MFLYGAPYKTYGSRQLPRRTVFVGWIPQIFRSLILFFRGLTWNLYRGYGFAGIRPEFVAIFMD